MLQTTSTTTHTYSPLLGNTKHQRITSQESNCNSNHSRHRAKLVHTRPASIHCTAMAYKPTNSAHQLTVILQDQTDKPILYTDAFKFQNYVGCAVTFQDDPFCATLCQYFLHCLSGALCHLSSGALLDQQSNLPRYNMLRCPGRYLFGSAPVTLGKLSH